MQLKQYGTWLGDILGPDHAKVKAHFEAVELYKEMESELQHAIKAAHGPSLGPSLFVFRFYLKH